MGRLAGKVAVVLGAAGQDNMGQVMARRFAEEGATVVVAGRRSEPLEALAAEIGGSAALCDITDKAQVDALAATALERHGRLDVAVNCTGWGLLAKLLDTRSSLGHMLELYEPGEALTRFYAFVRRKAVDWDGSEPLRRLR